MCSRRRRRHNSVIFVCGAGYVVCNRVKEEIKCWLHLEDLLKRLKVINNKGLLTECEVCTRSFCTDRASD